MRQNKRAKEKAKETHIEAGKQICTHRNPIKTKSETITYK